MVLHGRADSGAEDWRCPACGRHILMTWPPRFDMLVLDPGDPAAIHAGAKGGVLMQQANVAKLPSTDVPAEERQWLRSNGIDWDDLAG